MPWWFYWSLLRKGLDLYKTLREGASEREAQERTARYVFNQLQTYIRSSEPYPDFGMLYPRWAMLALLGFFPLFIIGAGVERLTPQHVCVLGLTCAITYINGWVQVASLLALYALFYVIALRFGVKPLAQDVKHNKHEPTRLVTRFFWAISAFDRLGGLVIGAAVVAIIAMSIAVPLHLFTPAEMALTIQVTILALLIVVYWWLIDHPANNPYKIHVTLDQIRRDLSREVDDLIMAANERRRWQVGFRRNRQNPPRDPYGNLIAPRFRGGQQNQHQMNTPNLPHVDPYLGNDPRFPPPQAASPHHKGGQTGAHPGPISPQPDPLAQPPLRTPSGGLGNVSQPQPNAPTTPQKGRFRFRFPRFRRKQNPPPRR